MASCVRIRALALTGLAMMAGCETPPRAVVVQPKPAFESRAYITLEEAQQAGREFRNAALRSMLTLSPGEQACVVRDAPPSGFASRCYVKIEVFPYTVGNSKYCLARLLDRIEFPVSESNKKKMMVFELVMAAPAVAVSYRFDKAHGIKVWGKPNSQITPLQRGNGDPGNTNSAQFHVRNDGKKEEAFYLPVILQHTVGGSDDEPEAVCAAADPKIINN
ncbi:hypothetical protein [Aquabacterium humicola]|uniref:hypothetical protein n=1 Tax=Aquabacterium humicola TaxID=3237377 RepID=UPI0025436139|nr:hypothetical protein [Rubrivivax pictus]